MKNTILNRFNYHEMDSETHAAFQEDVRSIVKKAGAGSLGITSIYNDVYSPAVDEELAVLDIITRSNYTPRIKEADTTRDNIVAGLTSTVKAFTRHPDPAKRAAGVALDAIISHYGKLQHPGDSKQTAPIDDLLRELDLPANKSLVTLLPATDWVDQLRASNAAFTGLMRDRDAEIAARPGKRVKELRVVTDAALASLLDRVEAQVILYGLTSSSSDYAPFVSAWNTLVDRYKRALAVARGRRLAAGKDPSAPEDPELPGDDIDEEGDE
jgi:hypothetical protein